MWARAAIARRRGRWSPRIRSKPHKAKRPAALRGPSDRQMKPLRSKLPEQRVAAGNFHLAGCGFEIELLDHAILDQHRVALGADAEPVAGGVELHADRLGEVGVAVGQEGGLVALVGVAL